MYNQARNKHSKGACAINNKNGLAPPSRGERFKDARTMYNKNGKQSMDDVYKDTGIAASMIKDLEDDDSNRSVGYDKIATLSKHYGVSSDYLLGLTPNPTTNKDLDAVCKYTGLSAGAIDNLIKTDSFVVEFVSFLLESGRIIPVGLTVSQCIDMLLEIEHYTNDVLPKLPRPNMQNLFPPFDKDEIDAVQARTKVIDEISKLRDLHDAKLWHCEKDICAAIEAFIDKKMNQYSKHTEA